MKYYEYDCQLKLIVEKQSPAEETDLTDSTPSIPDSVSSRQLRLQLLNDGIKLAEIDEIINMVSEPQKSAIKIQWEYSATFNRYDPVLIQMASVIGVDEDRLNDIFSKAILL